VVGDYEDGRVYAFDLDVYADDDQIQKVAAVVAGAGYGQNNLKRTAHHSCNWTLKRVLGLTPIPLTMPKI
jgi:hypothetical protein